MLPHVSSCLAIGCRYGPGTTGNLGLSKFHIYYPVIPDGKIPLGWTLPRGRQGPCLSGLPLYASATSLVPQYMNEETS